MPDPIRHTYPSGTQDQFNLRLPGGLRERIKKAAEDEGRSMNAEIVATLLEKYPEPTEDYRPILELFRHINAAENDAEFFARVQSINEFFHRSNADIVAKTSDGGTLTIEVKHRR
ncbi:hypothetical protein HYN69_10515 [Gemmobacter aquarius]|uniref:Arc-like DNA binding domain-containing protein n=1 Tax=Paragemmobacter aquarius TaxID=2169400 RepID=A0A2S0UM49_9RHOB|nr:Arc family DNA-binding protein [Gemmobacter aquarius]AWB48876.1 hypothetical protein HYN69_10515 [Gemmobacter aquarius]